MNHAEIDPRALLLASFKAAIAAVDPAIIVPQHLPKPPKGRTLVVGAGKAAAAMAGAVEAHWPDDAPLSGIVVTRYQHGLATKRIQTIEASHPVPDEAGESAAIAILNAVQQLGADDLCLALFSGGGSSLLALPVNEISLKELKQLTNALLRSGASIQEINTVRKHLSQIQGGRLAQACLAPVLALLISDVTGDEATHIASGPCAPDTTTYQQALSIIDRYNITASASIRQFLTEGINGLQDETPKTEDACFHRVENRVIGNANDMLTAASRFFANRGIPSAILGDTVTGEAREVAKVYAALTQEIHQHHRPWPTPIALISGGECTVTIKGQGRGGRCTEFLLSLAIALKGMPNVYALAADTDGIDGSEDNAGGIITPHSIDTAKKLNLIPIDILNNNDAYGFFEALGDLIITGPTYTNVNDYRVILLL